MVARAAPRRGSRAPRRRRRTFLSAPRPAARPPVVVATNPPPEARTHPCSRVPASAIISQLRSNESHAGIAARPVCGGFRRRRGIPATWLGDRQSIRRFQEPPPRAKAGGQIPECRWRPRTTPGRRAVGEIHVEHRGVDRSSPEAPHRRVGSLIKKSLADIRPPRASRGWRAQARWSARRDRSDIQNPRVRRQLAHQAQRAQRCRCGAGRLPRQALGQFAKDVHLAPRTRSPTVSGSRLVGGKTQPKRNRRPVAAAVAEFWPQRLAHLVDKTCADFCPPAAP